MEGFKISFKLVEAAITRAMRHDAVLLLNCVDDLLKTLGITSTLVPSTKQEEIEQCRHQN